VAITTSDTDQPSLRRRAAVRLGFFAAAASLSALGSVATSGPANAAEHGASCLAGGTAVDLRTAGGADCEDPVAAPQSGLEGGGGLISFSDENRPSDDVITEIANTVLLNGLRSRQAATENTAGGLDGTPSSFDGTPSSVDGEDGDAGEDASTSDLGSGGLPFSALFNSLPIAGFGR
jgi:hypothetical protein